MSDAPPPPPPPAHVVGADGGTIADGDARARATARARERAVAGRAAIDDAAADLWAAPVGPAYPPGYVPNFNIGAAPPFNPANYMAMMQAMPPLGAHARVPMPPLAAPQPPAINTTAPAAAAASTANNIRGRGRRPPAAAAAAQGRAAAAAARRPPSSTAARGTGTVQQQIDAANRENMAEKEKAAPKKYRLNYDKYVRHVKGAGIATERPFISVPGVEHFFSTVVAKEGDVIPDTALCRLTSLAYYADIEHPGVSLNLKTPTVMKSLQQQKQAHKIYQQTKSTKSPHSKLPTNVLTPSAFDKMMEHGFKEQGCNSWADFGFTMCAGKFCLLRMDSMRKLTLSTLVCDVSHGPERTGFASEMVGIVLLRGTQKTPGQGTRVAGAWPNRDFRRCTELFLATSLFVRLQIEPENFSFVADEEGVYSWRDFPVVQSWRDASSAETAYKAVTAACGINWKHVVHLRSAGIEEAGAWGSLSPDEISAMSKHWGGSADRLRESYVSELSRPTCAYFSGFGRDVQGNDGVTDWYVPECYLDVEKEFPGFVDRLFPLRQDWISETEDTCGDKDPCASNFLQDLLPHLALRLAQRGIYLINWAPNHPASTALMKAMGPEYAAWAAKKRIECDKLRADHDAKLNLKYNLGGTLHAISTQGEGAASTLGRIEKDLKTSIANQEAILANQKVIFEHITGGASTGTSRRARTRSAPLFVEPSLPSDSSADDDDGDGNNNNNDDEDEEAGEGGTRPTCSGTTGAIANANTNANASTSVAAAAPQAPPLRSVLFDRSLPPTVPQLFPTSAVQLLKEHNQGRFNMYRMADKKSWDSGLRQRYGKRQRMFQEIEAKAARMQSPQDVASRMKRAAEEMDKEKRSLKLSLTQYSEHLRRSHSSFRPRRKRKEDDGI